MQSEPDAQLPDAASTASPDNGSDIYSAAQAPTRARGSAAPASSPDSSTTIACACPTAPASNGGNRFGEVSAAAQPVAASRERRSPRRSRSVSRRPTCRSR